MQALWVLLPTGQRASGEWIDDTLRARVEEKGLLARTPRAGEVPRQRVELIRDADPVAAVNRLYRERGWTDGLPIVPPTLGRVDDMVGTSRLERHAVLGTAPLGGVATVEKIAVNAVMAGCEPSYFRWCWPRCRPSSIPRSTCAACRPRRERGAAAHRQRPAAARPGSTRLAPRPRLAGLPPSPAGAPGHEQPGGGAGRGVLRRLRQPARCLCPPSARTIAPAPLHGSGIGPSRARSRVRAETVINVTGGPTSWRA
jgi:hypothetical protein